MYFTVIEKLLYLQQVQSPEQYPQRIASTPSSLLKFLFYVKLCIMCVINQRCEHSEANILGFETTKKIGNSLVTLAAAGTL